MVKSKKIIVVCIAFIIAIFTLAVSVFGFMYEIENATFEVYTNKNIDFKTEKSEGMLFDTKYEYTKRDDVPTLLHKTSGHRWQLLRCLLTNIEKVQMKQTDNENISYYFLSLDGCAVFEYPDVKCKVYVLPGREDTVYGFYSMRYRNKIQSKNIAVYLDSFDEFEMHEKNIFYEMGYLQ